MSAKRKGITRAALDAITGIREGRVKRAGVNPDPVKSKPSVVPSGQGRPPAGGATVINCDALPDDLRPCPFCPDGGDVVSGSGLGFVSCNVCDVFGPGPIGSALQDHGVKAWNTRPLEDAKDVEIARLRGWKREALLVMSKWDLAAESVDAPLGTSQADAVRAELERLREVERLAMSVVRLTDGKTKQRDCWRNLEAALAPLEDKA